MTAAVSSPDLQRIVEALKACRERYEFVRGGQSSLVGRDGHIVFTGWPDECLAYIDARCAEAMVRAIVPAELVALSAGAAPGRWHGGHRCDGAITVGPASERVSIGSDLPADDARLAAEAVNLVRSLSAILGETQL